MSFKKSDYPAADGWVTAKLKRKPNADAPSVTVIKNFLSTNEPQLYEWSEIEVLETVINAAFRKMEFQKVPPLKHSKGCICRICRGLKPAPPYDINEPPMGDPHWKIENRKWIYHDFIIGDIAQTKYSQNYEPLTYLVTEIEGDLIGGKYGQINKDLLKNVTETFTICRYCEEPTDNGELAIYGDCCQNCYSQ